MTKKQKLGCWMGVAWLALIVVSVPLRGWILSVLWSWFVVPLGAAGIDMWHAAGFAAIVTLLTHRSESEESEDTSKLWGRLIAAAVVLPLLMLAFGWLFHLLMVAP